MFRLCSASHMMGRNHGSPCTASSTFSQEGRHKISAHISLGRAFQMAIVKCNGGKLSYRRKQKHRAYLGYNIKAFRL